MEHRIIMVQDDNGNVLLVSGKLVKQDEIQQTLVLNSTVQFTTAQYNTESITYKKQRVRRRLKKGINIQQCVLQIIKQSQKLQQLYHNKCVNIYG